MWDVSVIRWLEKQTDLFVRDYLVEDARETLTTFNYAKIQRQPAVFHFTRETQCSSDLKLGLGPHPLSNQLGWAGAY
jgi:hypothetical protein